jgi:teichuronic acid biosynthesis glycosyltransferase TuaC
MINILTFSTLYPNSVRPGHGIFVENRLRHLLATGEVSADVIAPAPWFPFSGNRFGEYGAFARVPHIETRHGISIHHPRYPLIPKIGMTIAPWLIFQAMKNHIRNRLENGNDFDLIDAHYFYPDGVAAAMLGRHFNKPVVITARGSDVNVIAEFSRPRQSILRAAESAASVITVSEALRSSLRDLGVAADKITTLRNGVDLETFSPVDRSSARQSLGISGNVILVVGNFVEAKGQHLVLTALAGLPSATLLLAGNGPEEASLRRQTEELGLNERVRFLGRVAHEDLATIYSAADVSILASAQEGWPNVILESMACGAPVVATNVGGVTEIIGNGPGRVLNERTPEAIIEGINGILLSGPDRTGTRRYAEGFSWDETSRGQIELFQRILKA